MESYRGNKILKLIKDNLKVTNIKVLDVGCGLNNLFFKFQDYTGLDINNYGTTENIVIKNLNDDTDIPFSDESFDLVMCTEFLEHTFRPDAISKEINRICKKDGLIIISLPNEFTLNCRIGFALGLVLNKGFDPYTHKYIFNRKRIQEFMDAYYSVIGKDEACLGVFLEKLPDEVNDFLVKLSPDLFAKSIIYACRKR